MNLSYDGKTLKVDLEAPRNKASTLFSAIMKALPDAPLALSWDDTITLTTAARSSWLWAAKARLDTTVIRDVLASGPADCVRTVARLAMCAVDAKRKHKPLIKGRDFNNDGLWKWEETSKECLWMATTVEQVLAELPLTRLVEVWKYVCGGYSCYHQFARIVPKSAIPVLIPLVKAAGFTRYSNNQIGTDEKNSRNTLWVLTERLRDPKFEEKRLSAQLPKLK